MDPAMRNGGLWSAGTPPRWEPRWRPRWPGTALVLALGLVGLMLAACSPPPGDSTAGGEPPRSAAQEAMVDRQLFQPRFSTPASPAPPLAAPLGSPGAAPLGQGALLGDD